MWQNTGQVLAEHGVGPSSVTARRWRYGPEHDPPGRRPVNRLVVKGIAHHAMVAANRGRCQRALRMGKPASTGHAVPFYSSGPSKLQPVDAMDIRAAGSMWRHVVRALQHWDRQFDAGAPCDALNLYAWRAETGSFIG